MDDSSNLSACWAQPPGWAATIELLFVHFASLVMDATRKEWLGELQRQTKDVFVDTNLLETLQRAQPHA